MAIISEERFCEDVYEVNGFDLYSCDEYLTDGSMIFDKRCVMTKNCTVLRELEQSQKDVIYKHISPEVLHEVVRDENLITKEYEYPLDRGYLFSTDKGRDVLMSEVYHKIFECSYPIYIYKDMFYFFSQLPKTEANEADELMFIGCVMRMQTFQQQISNIKAVNRFIENLPKIERSLDKLI